MHRIPFILLLTFISIGATQAQSLLRDSVISVTAFEFAYTPAFTAFDLQEKADLIHVLSPSISVKNGKNILYLFSANIMLGHKLKENDVPNFVFSEVGVPITTDGFLEEVNPRFQGLEIQMQVGKLLKRSKHNKNSGLWAHVGAGVMRHKINYDYATSTVPQLENPYVKGYDRLTYGASFSQFLGFRRYANKNLLNYQFGIEIHEGFTQNRRSWNYDTMLPDTRNRLDMYYGLKFAFILPYYGTSY